MLASGSDFSDSMLCCCGSNELALTRSKGSPHISMLTEMVNLSLDESTSTVQAQLGRKSRLWQQLRMLRSWLRSLPRRLLAPMFPAPSGRTCPPLAGLKACIAYLTVLKTSTTLLGSVLAAEKHPFQHLRG